ncbi:ABC transporter substrate-binding protein [Paenibacillus daejeonensis]|uniref:ABC transporter substrate-binding protein n=1 Tax=Paenibacillus daejeonensis TaxID=135193 RepID=UPI00037BE4EC|nr:ABC transporter substrate-binding protein [Paenibacillus daejeonensis]
MRSSKKYVWVSMMMVALLFAAACGNAGNSSNENGGHAENAAPVEAVPEAQAAEERAEVAGPITVQDVTGETITLDGPVQQIACIVSLCVDVLAELEMEPAAVAEGGVRVIASAPEFYGSAGESFPSIGGSFFEPSLEDLVTAAPDLVIGLQGVHDSLREGLGGIAPLYLVNPSHYNESLDILEAVGQMAGKTEAAAAAKQRFMEKLEQAAAEAPKDKKAVIIYGSDVNFSVITDSGLGGTVMTEIAEYPWKVERPEDDPYGEGAVPYSLERLITEDPDVIFVQSYSFSPDAAPVSEQLAASPLWEKLTAVQNGQVHEVRSPIWGDGRGTRSLGILIDESMAILYPELQ